VRYKLSIRVTVFLIVLTILVITAFQAYWLRKNYREEKRLFSVRTGVLFRETVFRLEAAKLKMDSNINIRVHDREGLISISNVLQERLQDSAAAVPPGRTMVVAFKDGHVPRRDVAYRGARRRAREEKVFAFLAGVDSLRDTITVKELSDRYRQALTREGIHVPFSIRATPLDTNASPGPPSLPGSPGPPPLGYLEDNAVTVGFTRPVSYQVQFENNTWYLLRRISQPIMVSMLLLGVTILSFLSLYRNLRQQRKLAQLKNDFISNMTHELKTPIATVTVAIEALRSFDALEDPQRTNEYLDISANEMQRLGLLVDKVLKLSMFENREIALNKERFDLRALARSVMVSMKLQFEKQQATTTLKATGSNFMITADKLHMTSVLYNLLDNALKYSNQDPDILIHIIDHKQYLELRVTDNGIGIAKEYAQRVFEKFFRVPSGNRHNIKGYGLGLSYVSHIVQRHMGRMEVESEPGKGSTFSVKLPFAETRTFAAAAAAGS